ncbi:DinB family protein [Nocardioides sp. Kera G14]|uniref:DinB family protein n=1 Tax=Nocardioides sp. Kera G14 TaxID=2884264 RepID=UPI001D12720A|nr:DinB family protein [Nocardioides sp. Kera G14]UDY22888.1 DinB family protein [Nocardioides sp. Kera G14]
MAIVPDDKDWTWVLERPCGECGFDPAAWPFPSIPATARELAEQWAEMLGERSAEEVTTRPDDATWSPLEYAAHIRDVNRIMLSRLNLILVLDDPEFVNWDQDGSAEALAYNSQDADEVADELLAAGEAMASALFLVKDEQLQRTGKRSNGSRFTVETLARYFLHDIVHHTHDVGLA